MVTSRDLAALIVCGGGPIRRSLPETGLVVAADGGLSEALRLGLEVDLLIGDMDSARPGDVEAFEESGGRIERFPRDKDATDLELALQAVSERGARSVTVAGGSDGRLDHLFGNALVLASDRWARMQVDAIFGPSLVHVLRGERALRGSRGELISLFAAGAIARGVTTEGLRWELRGEDLTPGSGRGISNEFVRPEARIRVGEGVLLAVRPGEVS